MSIELGYKGRPLIMNVVRQKCSPLLFGKGLTLAGGIETLSDRLDKSFHDTVLMACRRYIP